MPILNLGFIGAGGIARSHHLPNLAAIEGVKVVAVANRSRESSQAIAKDFNIPDIMDDWHALIARPDLDAVFIGTWPYMHMEMSIAALNAGKHVFCQARMAMDLAQAKAMVAAAHAHPHLVHMICPPPQRMPYEPYIRTLLSGNELGSITAVELTSISSANIDPTKIHWRERAEFSGKNILALGIFAETLNAWLGPYEELSARLATPIPTKTGPDGTPVSIGVPQVVTITGRLKSGALITEYHTGLAADASTPGSQLTIHGLHATLRTKFTDTLELAPKGQPFYTVNVPINLRKGWYVENDFIAAVRAAKQNQPWKVSPDFDEALLYMQKIEAIHLAAQTGRNVRVAEL